MVDSKVWVAFYLVHFGRPLLLSLIVSGVFFSILFGGFAFGLSWRMGVFFLFFSFLFSFFPSSFFFFWQVTWFLGFGSDITVIRWRGALIFMYLLLRVRAEGRKRRKRTRERKRTRADGC